MNRQRRRRRPDSGFTLLEVLLVLAILVILGSTVTFFFARTQTQANKRAAKVQISNLEQLMDQYRIDVGTYPSSQQGLSALSTVPPDLPDPSKWGGPYLKKEIPPDPWNNPYQYELVSADIVRIWSLGPDGQSGTDDDITNE